jgi:hypothetical protein
LCIREKKETQKASNRDSVICLYLPILWAKRDKYHEDSISLHMGIVVSHHRGCHAIQSPY